MINQLVGSSVLSPSSAGSPSNSKLSTHRPLISFLSSAVVTAVACCSAPGAFAAIPTLGTVTANGQSCSGMWVVDAWGGDTCVSGIGWFDGGGGGSIIDHDLGA